MDTPYFEITAQEARELYGKDEVLVLDVRQPEQFERERVQGSILVPIRRLKERTAGLPRDKKILLICEWGTKGVMAAELMLAAGFLSQNLYVISDGMMGCKKAGFPLETGSPVAS